MHSYITLKKSKGKPIKRGQLVGYDYKPIFDSSEKQFGVVTDVGDTYTVNSTGELYTVADDYFSGVQGRSTGSKSVIIVGDMHVGHKYALGSPLKKLQKVNAFWKSARDQLLKQRANVFVINGEPIDGDQPRQLGGELWVSDMGQQMEVANDYISHFKMDSIGITRGSNYHSTRGNTNFESILTKYLTCAPILDYSPYGKLSKYTRASESVVERDPVGHRPYSRIEDILQMRVNGVVFNIIHHTGTPTNFATLPSSIAQQILKNMIQTGRLWTVKDAPRITIRSHTHHFVLVEYGNSIGWVNPAWQIFSMYTLQKSMAAATIGMVEVIIESNGKYLVNKILLPDKDYPKIRVIEI